MMVLSFPSIPVSKKSISGKLMNSHLSLPPDSKRVTGRQRTNSRMLQTATSKAAAFGN
jgi:hypothetical protein